MNALPRTRLAVLGTLSDLHRQPIAYDLACLRSLVAGLAPDLVCAEVTQATWEGGELDTAVLEVREALAPVVAATDVVLIPVAPEARQFDDFPGDRRLAAPRGGCPAAPAALGPAEGRPGRSGQRRLVRGVLPHRLLGHRAALDGAGPGCLGGPDAGAG